MNQPIDMNSYHINMNS